MNRHVIISVEEALGIKLLPYQKAYILGEINHLGNTRGSGRTLAYIIRLVLSDGEPLDMSRPWLFSDRIDGDFSLLDNKRYANGFFKREFLGVYTLLESKGLKLRPINRKKNMSYNEEQ